MIFLFQPFFLCEYKPQGLDQLAMRLVFCRFLHQPKSLQWWAINSNFGCLMNEL
jgi:hypothetical protein